jgi:hypothetical protein
LSASETFAEANLSGLGHLSLKGANFLMHDVDTAGIDDVLNIATAYRTFYHTNLSGLLTLDLKGVAFAGSNMATGSSSSNQYVYTA